ncbi:endo-polygalacturonase [Sarracenia purpurea var. burkii]
MTTATTYNVVTLGATRDGKKDSTKSFLRAWAAACGSKTPATIYVPSGKYLVGKTVFGGECKNHAITFRIDGTLVAPSNYNVLGHGGNWIVFEHVNGVSIYGGTLDGQGTGLWACKTNNKRCPIGATVC